MNNFDINVKQKMAWNNGFIIYSQDQVKLKMTVNGNDGNNNLFVRLFSVLKLKVMLKVINLICCNKCNKWYFMWANLVWNEMKN